MHFLGTAYDVTYLQWKQRMLKKDEEEMGLGNALGQAWWMSYVENKGK